MPIGILGAAGIGLGSSLIGGAFNSFLNGNQDQKQRDFINEQREKQEQFQNFQRESQNDFAQRMYTMYQSPQALAAQYKAAGLNPRLAADGGQVGNVAASSGSSGSAPSGANYAPAHNSFSTGFVDMANAFAALAQAKKAGVETDRLKRFMNEELRGIELSNNAQELLNSVNEKYLDKHTSALLKRVIQEYSLGTIKAEEMRSQLELLAKENLIKQKTVDHWDETYRNAQENIKADTEVKYSTTMVNDSIKTLNESKVLTESTVRSLNRSLSRLNAALSSSAEIQALIDSDTYEAKTIKEYNVSKAEAEKALRDFYQFRSELEQIAEHNINDDDWQALEYLLNWTFNGIRRLSRSVQGKSAFD